MATYTFEQLQTAGLPIVRVFEDPFGTQAEFSRGLTPVENMIFLKIADPKQAARLQGVSDAANIPNWATWTQAEFAAWYNANISPAQINAETTLADAKVVQLAMSAELKALGQMAIAQRDMLAFLLDRVT